MLIFTVIFIYVLQTTISTLFVWYRYETHQAIIRRFLRAYNYDIMFVQQLKFFNASIGTEIELRTTRTDRLENLEE